jgi:hypothetical protein
MYFKIKGAYAPRSHHGGLYWVNGHAYVLGPVSHFQLLMIYINIRDMSLVQIGPSHSRIAPSHTVD